jgi:hypothetical protein
MVKQNRNLMSYTCGRCRSLIDKEEQWSTRQHWADSDLSPDLVTYLNSTRYQGLCANCIGELNQKVVQTARMNLPKNGADFIEGLHYTVEFGKIVFTEFYHIQRGYCCGSGCRHCAYGFVPITKDY